MAVWPMYKASAAGLKKKTDDEVTNARLARSFFKTRRSTCVVLSIHDTMCLTGKA